MIYVIGLVVILYFVFRQTKKEKIDFFEMEYYGPDKYNRLKSEGKSTKIDFMPDYEIDNLIRNGDVNQQEYFSWLKRRQDEMKKLYGVQKQQTTRMLRSRRHG